MTYLTRRNVLRGLAAAPVLSTPDLLLASDKLVDPERRIEQITAEAAELMASTQGRKFRSMVNHSIGLVMIVPEDEGTE